MGLLLAVLVCIPNDLAARRAPSPAKDLPADLALVPGDCVGFFTLRHKDLRSDPFVVAILGLAQAFFVQEQIVRVPPEQVERVTQVIIGDAEAIIVRTSKPYDSTAVLSKLRRGFGSKRAFRKVNGKTIIYYGLPERWTDALCLVDRNVFVAGRLPALEHLLSTKAKPSEELSDALGRADKHTLVACIQGEPLRAVLARAERGFGPEDKLGSDAKGLPAPGKGIEKEEMKVAGEASSEKNDPLVPPEWLPYKPLLLGRTALLTADVKPSLKATLQISFAEKADLAMAETALKISLYVGGEVVASLRRIPSLKVLRGVGETARKAIRSAPIERTETSLRTMVSLNVDEATRKLVSIALIPAARLTAAQNNLKHLVLAMHSAHEAMECFLPPAITDAKGKALLSWRVALLPFLGEMALYREFKLDEPWDSPHNKKLLEKMPRVYAPLGVKTKEPSSTFYQLCTGPNTPWPTPTTKATLPVITVGNGASNTFLIVEAGEPVPWTKPVDLAIDPKKPLPKLGAQIPERFVAVMADGSIHSLRRDLDPKILRLLIDPTNVQPILWDKILEKK
jgi:hypothetical protein